jgi:RecB family endonuclease NucS
MGFRIIGRHVSLLSGPCDILAIDHAGQTWVIELKPVDVTASTIKQVLRYQRDLIEH